MFGEVDAEMDKKDIKYIICQTKPVATCHQLYGCNIQYRATNISSAHYDTLLLFVFIQTAYEFVMRLLLHARESIYHLKDGSGVT